MKKILAFCFIVSTQLAFASSYSQKIDRMLKIFPVGSYQCDSLDFVEIIHYTDQSRELKGILFKVPLGDFGGVYNSDSGKRSLEHSPQDLSWRPFAGYKFTLSRNVIYVQDERELRVNRIGNKISLKGHIKSHFLGDKRASEFKCKIRL